MDTFTDPKGSKENISCTMDDVRKHFLGPPHGTTPAAVTIYILNIMSHLDEHKLLSDRQYVFRKSHSCETQLATVIDGWAKSLENQCHFDPFFL